MEAAFSIYDCYTYEFRVGDKWITDDTEEAGQGEEALSPWDIYLKDILKVGDTFLYRCEETWEAKIHVKSLKEDYDLALATCTSVEGAGPEEREEPSKGEINRMIEEVS